MVSSRVRQALKLAAALLALAAHAHLHAQAPAPLSSDDTEAAIAGRHQQTMETIQEILSRDGPYSPKLLEPLTALIVLYEEGGDDEFAAVAIERARQVVRVNNGLHTLEQVPLIKQLIRIEEARGNHAAAWDLEQELLALVRRYPDDMRTVPVLREVADRQMDVLATYLDGTKPPQLYLGCYYNSSPNSAPGDCDSGTRKTVVQGMLADAQRSYSEAIAVMLRNGLYDNEELRELELELLRGVDMVRTMYDDDWRGEALPLAPGWSAPLKDEPWRGRTAPILELANWDLPYLDGRSSGPAELETRIDNTYDRGRQSLRRLYAYDAASSRPLLSQAGAVVQMADWDLLYSHHGRAIESYELVRAVLQRAGVTDASIEQLFLPPIPVVLPAFQPNPLARDDAGDATGHIDVAFEITKYGRGRAVEILDAANATRDAQDRLVHLITTSRFRPRPTNGMFDHSARIVVRYYLH